jgi:ribokinase
MIIVFGSLNADLFFAVDRLPTPGETVLTPTVTLQPGGKGANQAAAAALAGAETRFVGCVGDDALGAPVLAALAAVGCDVSGVSRVPGATGTAAVMVEASGANQIVVASGANGAVRAEHLGPGDLRAGTTLVCQMEIPTAENAKVLARAKRAGVRTVLNLAPAQPVQRELLDDVDVLVVNEGEAEVLAGRQAAPAATARQLAARHGLTCLVTLGGAGAVAMTAEGSGWRIGVLPVTVVDTVGAGDAFVGMLAASLDRGADLPTALHRASVAAGLACTRAGAMAAMASADEIEGRLSELPAAAELGHGEGE